jgi:hypothetical protein
MWVMIALFWASANDTNDLLTYYVYHEKVFSEYQQCQTVLLDNRQNIVDGLSSLNISNRFSVKCIDANEYPEVQATLKKQGIQRL